MKIFNLHKRKDLRRRLRQDMSVAEIRLWMCLKGKQLSGYKFRRQHGINFYVVDFYCPAANLVVELDGDSHMTAEARQHDLARDTYLSSLGLKTIRFRNERVFDDVEGVLRTIREHLAAGG